MSRGAIIAVAFACVVAGLLAGVLVERRSTKRIQPLRRQHNRQIAQLVASARQESGRVDFRVISAAVEQSSKINIPLVYALLVDRAGNLQNGAINGKQFAGADAKLRELLNQGKKKALSALVQDASIRRGLINEFSSPVPSGAVRLGFLRSPAPPTGLTGLLWGGGIGLAIGVLVALLLATLVKSKPQSQPAERSNLAQSYLPQGLADRLDGLDDISEVPTEEFAAVIASIGLVEASSLAMTLPASEALSTLNDYLPEVIDAVLGKGGVVLSIDSGSIRAMWTTAAGEQAEARALHALREAHQDVEALTRRKQLAGQPLMRLRSALDTGRVALANVGSVRRTTYAAVGAPAVVALEIERQLGGGQRVVTEAVRRRLPEGTVPDAAQRLAVGGVAVNVYIDG